MDVELSLSHIDFESERVDAETLRVWGVLAREVYDDLAAAGIPLLGIAPPFGADIWRADGSNYTQQHSGGALITIDGLKPGDTLNANIWVSWEPHWELTAAAVDCIENRYHEAAHDPAIRRKGEECRKMCDTMMEILKLSGYVLSIDEDPYTIYIFMFQVKCRATDAKG